MARTGETFQSVKYLYYTHTHKDLDSILRIYGENLDVVRFVIPELERQSRQVPGAP